MVAHNFGASLLSYKEIGKTKNIRSVMYVNIIVHGSLYFSGSLLGESTHYLGERVEVDCYWKITHVRLS